MTTDSKMIKVWRYWDAPAELQALSRHGGDEDWLAVIPAGEDVPMWMESGERSSFAICELQVTELPDGRKVCIGAHA